METNKDKAQFSTPDGKSQLIIIQATPFCNLSCDYCYLFDRNNRRKMTLETLGTIVDRIFESNFYSEDITFVWHAGEPLAAGKEFYRKAFAYVDSVAKEKSVRWRQSLQTNGTLLDHDWIDIFALHDVAVGISIDGPAFLHDLRRKTRRGGATHSRVMRSIYMLRERGFSFSVIAVVTRETLKHPLEFFDFFSHLGATVVALNVEELEGTHESSSLDASEIRSEMRIFWRLLLEYNKKADCPIRIREFMRFDPIISMHSEIVPDMKFSMNTMVDPFSIFSFDVNGNVSTYCPELMGAKSERFQDFIIGNILDKSLDNLIASNKTLELMREEIALGRNRCKTECDYWDFCGGGVPSNKFFETGRFDSTKTSYCVLHRQALVDAIFDYCEFELCIT